ncbi:MAG: hypothetical protein RLY70_3899, partial [Planctomycetota bacterium]
RGQAEENRHFGALSVSLCSQGNFPGGSLDCGFPLAFGTAWDWMKGLSMRWHGLVVAGLCLSASVALAQTRAPGVGGPGSQTTGTPRTGTGAAPATGRPTTSGAGTASGTRPTGGLPASQLPGGATQGGTTGTRPKMTVSSGGPATSTGTLPAGGTTRPAVGAGTTTGGAALGAAAGGAAVGTATTRPATGAPLSAGTGGLNARDYASYAIGLDMAARFQADGTTVNLDQLLMGLKDGFAGAKPRYSEEQLRAAAEAFDREVQARAAERFKMVAEQNKKASATFLAENKKKPTVKSTASGLQYEVIKAGPGRVTAKATDTVKANYHGTLIDGTVFDTTQGDQPVVIEASNAIAGWTEALQLMRAGDKWRLYVPSELAYGAEGYGPVPPNALLIFELELLEITAPVNATPVGQGTLPRQIK